MKEVRDASILHGASPAVHATALAMLKSGKATLMFGVNPADGSVLVACSRPEMLLSFEEGEVVLDGFQKAMAIAREARAKSPHA